MRMKYSALFFDFDGVLADSVEVKARAFSKLFETYGPQIQAKVVDHHRRNGGMTRKEKFEHYYSEFLGKPIGDSEMELLCKAFSSLVVDAVVAAPEIPFARAFLEAWYQKLPCFIVSATPDEEIAQIVRRRQMEKYFAEIRGSSQSKPSNLKELLTIYELSARKCLFFGDAESDYRAAMEYGVDFIGIVPGPDAHLLKVAPGVQWVRSFEELMGMGCR